MRTISNLLRETQNAIKQSGHTPADIVFIGSEESGHRCTWDEFRVLANRDYDAGFGGAEVNTKLVIRFADGQSMWRGEYDGNEWWEFSPPAPSELPPPKPITTLFTGWRDFDEWRVRHAMRRLMARLDRALAEFRPLQVAALASIITGAEQ